MRRMSRNIRRIPPTRRIAITVALVFAGLALAGCDTSGALESTKNFFDAAAQKLDAALGLGEAKPFDRLAADDIKLANDTKQKALETRRDGEPLAWRNVKTGNSGSITPVRTFMTEAGVFCREYREVVLIGVERGEAINTGCRTDGKSWS